uniref:[histone H3]-dimethyl-L-lysine(9) demethylase n=1 Tax=Glossina austeni TaxID=7395 RepID=A0A1A9VPG5_GLOAU
MSEENHIDVASSPNAGKQTSPTSDTINHIDEEEREHTETHESDDQSNEEFVNEENASAIKGNKEVIEKPYQSLEELMNMRLKRKREIDDSGVDGEQRIGELAVMPAKQFRLENHINERKSIIEIHLTSEDVKKPLLTPKTVAELEENVKQKISDVQHQIIKELDIFKREPLVSMPSIEIFREQPTPDTVKGHVILDAVKEAVTLDKFQSIADDKNPERVDLKSPEKLTAIEVETSDAINEIISNESIDRTEDSNHQNQEKEDEELSLEKLTPEEEIKDQAYKKSCEKFRQHLPCFKLQSSASSSPCTDDTINNVPKISKCRECRRRTPQQGSNDVYCRFYEFRCLQYTPEGQLVVAGFPNPYTDATQDDMNIWQPDGATEPTAGYMDIQVCRYILLHVGDQFCHLWRQEVQALKLHENPNEIIAWKKVVQGIREICDVCDTTLFNFHWTCDKCGFGVCLDCFKDRKEERPRRKTFAGDKPPKGRDEYYWMLCTGGSIHNVKELILTQIIAGDALNVLGQLLHDVRTLWQIPQLCGCLLGQQELPDGDLKNYVQDMIKESQLKQQTSASSLATEETKRNQARLEQIHAKTLEFARACGIDYVPGRLWTKHTLGKDPITTAFDNFKHINFLRKGLTGYRRFLPPRAMTLAHSTLLAPGVPHEWLCDGKLLRLTDTNQPDNRILFQEVWKCGQPVMISEVAKSLDLDLWRPEAFLRDFGDKPNDLINCLNGNLVPNQPMRHFWEGFQCMKKRLLDANGKPMLLKLKDWPPGDDFAEILPTRYKDLMKGLPMPEYTLRTGNLNIASCLPKMFVPPDLGPKMYNAYGSAFHPDKGTTNLHLDISDAVNIMVYVGIPEDADSKSQISASHRAIAMGGCEFLTRARVLQKNVFPGALWHIFPARDADKIRDLLNRVTLEKGYRLEPDHDPIHDQNWYLDDKLRARLFKEYGVEGFAIVQCLGDAVFIPAGAPHQVQNLHNCIKVAEDFVSPENITHCFHLTQEFRRLSHSHTNHEDKLQIKNIVYHAIKDCCTILMRALEKRIDQEMMEAEKLKAELDDKKVLRKGNKSLANGKGHHFVKQVSVVELKRDVTLEKSENISVNGEGDQVDQKVTAIERGHRETIEEPENCSANGQQERIDDHVLMVIEPEEEATEKPENALNTRNENLLDQEMIDADLNAEDIAEKIADDSLSKKEKFMSQKVIAAELIIKDEDENSLNYSEDKSIDEEVIEAEPKIKEAIETKENSSDNGAERPIDEKLMKTEKLTTDLEIKEATEKQVKDLISSKEKLIDQQIVDADLEHIVQEEEMSSVNENGNYFKQEMTGAELDLNEAIKEKEITSPIDTEKPIDQEILEIEQKQVEIEQGKCSYQEMMETALDGNETVNLPEKRPDNANEKCIDQEMEEAEPDFKEAVNMSVEETNSANETEECIDHEMLEDELYCKEAKKQEEAKKSSINDGEKHSDQEAVEAELYLKVSINDQEKSTVNDSGKCADRETTEASPESKVGLKEREECSDNGSEKYSDREMMDAELDVKESINKREKSPINDEGKCIHEDTMEAVPSPINSSANVNEKLNDQEMTEAELDLKKTTNMNAEEDSSAIDDEESTDQEMAEAELDQKDAAKVHENISVNVDKNFSNENIKESKLSEEDISSATDDEQFSDREMMETELDRKHAMETLQNISAIADGKLSGEEIKGPKLDLKEDTNKNEEETSSANSEEEYNDQELIEAEPDPNDATKIRTNISANVDEKLSNENVKKINEDLEEAMEKQEETLINKNEKHIDPELLEAESDCEEAMDTQEKSTANSDEKCSDKDLTEAESNFEKEMKTAEKSLTDGSENLID